MLQLTTTQANRLEAAGLHIVTNKQKTGNLLVEDITIKSLGRRGRTAAFRVRYSIQPHGYARRYKKISHQNGYIEWPVSASLNNNYKPITGGTDELLAHVIKRANKYRQFLNK